MAFTPASRTHTRKGLVDSSDLAGRLNPMSWQRAPAWRRSSFTGCPFRKSSVMVLRFFEVITANSMLPNKSPEPTVVGACCLFALDFWFFIDFSPRWLSFFRSAAGRRASFSSGDHRACRLRARRRSWPLTWPDRRGVLEIERRRSFSIRSFDATSPRRLAPCARLHLSPSRWL